MTSASELFYNRRSRFGRSDVELGFDSSHQHNNRRLRHTTANNRRDLDGCDPLRRSPNHRHSHYRHSERESVWLDQSSIPSASFDVNVLDNGSNIRDRLRSTGNDRLPGAVLLARERLLQRLRGVSLSGSSTRIPSSIYHNDLIVEDDLRLAEAGDWETGFSRDWQGETSPFTDSLQQETSKRPPGLTKEALDCLFVEVFSNGDRCDEEKISRASQECSICLESFLEGDKLIRLPCGHRFHHCCLDPWVRICACCPYCRKDIVVNITNTQVRKAPTSLL